MGEIEVRFPAWLWVIAALVLAVSFAKSRDRYLARLVFLVPGLLLIFPVLGNVNLWLLQELHVYERVEPYQANLDVMIGTLGLVLVVRSAIRRDVVPVPPRAINYDRLNQVTLWGTVIGTAINLLNFRMAGGIPILRDNLVGDERFTIAQQMVLPGALVVSSAFLTINLLALLDRSRWGATRLHLLCLPFNLLMAAGIGSRHLVLLPIVVAFLFRAFTRRVGNRWLIAGILAVPLLGVAQQTLRGDSIYEIGAQQGAEYRDYLLLDEEFGFNDFQYGATLYPIATNAIPKQVFALLDLDKQEFAKYSAFLAQDLWGADSGIRTGIWGEFFINWGGLGVTIGLIVFGFALASLDTAMLRRRYDEPMMLFLSFIASMMIFAVIGSWASIGDTLGTYGVFFFLVSRIRSTTNDDSKSR